MMRRGFTLIELMIATGISAFVLTALSLVYFLTLNYYRTILAETLQPTTARSLRDRLYFSLCDTSGNPTGLGLLSYSTGQIAAYQLGGEGKGKGKGKGQEDSSVKPPELGFVHMPPELNFDTGWSAMCDIVTESTTTNALRFSPRGVLHGGTTNRCELLFYLTPFGASQPMATADGTSTDTGGAPTSKSRPGQKGAVL